MDSLLVALCDKRDVRIELTFSLSVPSKLNVKLKSVGRSVFDEGVEVDGCLRWLPQNSRRAIWAVGPPMQH